MFRGKFLVFLEEAFDSGELEFYGQLRELAHTIRFSDLLSSLHNKEWGGLCKAPVWRTRPSPPVAGAMWAPGFLLEAVFRV